MSEKNTLKKIHNIKALSFDLDDTLYDNIPVIKNAFSALYDHLADHYPNIKNYYNFEQFLKAANHLKHDQTEIFDLSKLRHIHIEQVLKKSGYQTIQTTEAFNVFWQARQKVTLYPDVIETLTQLSKRFPMVSISNGNACLKAIGIDHFFQHSIMVSDHCKPKPDNSMFLLACKKLAIKPENLLHIGDSLEKDINAAHRAGCRSIWFNANRQMAKKIKADAIIVTLSDLLTPNFF